MTPSNSRLSSLASALASTLTPALALALSALVFSTSACTNTMDSAADSDEITTPAPSPTPPTMAIFAEGWNGILITANYAKTTVDKVGHWVTTRNACGKDADGAIELDFWNRLAEAVNKSIATEPLAESRCSPIPTDSKMDGTVDAMLQQRGVRTLLEVRDNEICTTIKDPQVAAELIDAVSKIVDIADKEDCPNGWGSG